MNSPELNAALCDLTKAIVAICLGSVEHVVIEAAGKELILNWNDHMSDSPIDTDAELAEWNKRVERGF